MRSARDITAAEIHDPDPTTVNIGQTLSKVRAKMEDHGHRVIPVVDGKRFVGMLSYQDVIEKSRSDPSSTKLDGMTHTPPTVSEDTHLIDLAIKRMNSGRKMFAMLGDHERLTGVISEREMVQHITDIEELQDATVNDLMSTDLITAREDESHETARKKMVENSVSRLPVVDDDGEIVGLITSNDLFRTMVPRQEMTDGDYKHHKESLSDIPVSELMQPRADIEYLFIEESADLPHVIETAIEHNHSGAVVVAGDAPVGILTLRDVLDHLSGYEAVEGLEVQLAGVDVPQEQEAILEKVQSAVRGSLGRMMTRPQKLSIHVKKYEQDGTRHKYSLTFKYDDAKQGLKNVKAHDWELLNAVDQGLDELEGILKKERSKQITESRKEDRERKYQ